MRASDLLLPSHVAPTGTLANGSSLGRFVVLGLVGRGAMGEVYAAYDPNLDRKIAIKLVGADDGTDGHAGHSRLMREAQATARISHPNVVVVHEADTLGNRVFIAMEFVEGNTLRYWLEAKNRTWLEVLDVFIAAGRGLAAAHDKDLVHRDFKPDNVMVSSNGQVRVMDFGLARWGAAPRLEREAPATDGPVLRLERAAVIDPTATQKLGDSARTTSPGTPAALDEKLTRTGTRDGDARLHVPRAVSRPIRRRALRPVQLLRRAVRSAVQRAAVRGADARRARRLRRRGPAHRTAGVRTGPRVAAVRAEARAVRESGGPLPVDERAPGRRSIAARAAAQTGFENGAAARLEGIWTLPSGDAGATAPEKDEVRRAFLATGKAYAEATFDRTRTAARSLRRALGGPLPRGLRSDARARRAVDRGSGSAYRMLDGGPARPGRALPAVSSRERGRGRERRRRRDGAARRRNAAGTSSSCARSCGPRPTRPRRLP